MIVIRPAKKRDWPTIEGLILADPDLQHGRLPHWSDFTVLTVNGEIQGCCALKVYGRKLGEIRSFAFQNDWARGIFSETLVRLCVDRARELKIYQILATICRKEQTLFRKLGFRSLIGQKHAMLMPIAGRQLLALKGVAGVKFVRARTRAHWQGIVRLAESYKRVLIQPETKLFPAKGDFVVAVVGSKVVGCAALTRFRGRHGRPCDIAEIRTVVVDSAYGGRGIGPQLVSRCVNLAIESGLVELFTVTGKKGWFERLGFSTRRGSEEAWFMKLGKNGTKGG
ncbi:MAG: GNAT family N-acetyltransferase [Patescibacteria group bacterium]|nr:GNAT family N-acetyltransferase [Patescibacteria group bacterium]